MNDSAATIHDKLSAAFDKLGDQIGERLRPIRVGFMPGIVDQDEKRGWQLFDVDAPHLAWNHAVIGAPDDEDRRFEICHADLELLVTWTDEPSSQPCLLRQDIRGRG